MVGSFMQIPSEFIMLIWDNIFFAVSAPHMKKNTHLAEMYPHLNKQYSALYHHAILQFYGEQPFNFLCLVIHITNRSFRSWYKIQVSPTGLWIFEPSVLPYNKNEACVQIQHRPTLGEGHHFTGL
jgi:hypothetical protein